MGLANHPPFATQAHYVTARVTGTVNPYHAVILVGKGPTLQVRQATDADDPARVYWAGPVRAEAGSGGSVRGAASVAVTLDYPCPARVAPGETLQAGDYASINGSGQLVLDAESPSFVIQQTETDGSTGVPAYALVDRLAVEGTPRTLVRFKMKSHLPLGGKGKAIEIGTGAAYTDIGSQFPIKDPWSDPGSWRDDTGSGETAGSYMGWCLIPDNPELADGAFQGGAFEGQPFREIIWMEQIATYVNFSATGATTKDTETPANPWTVTGTVDDWYQGKDPAGAFSSFTFYDPQQLFPYVMNCSKGMARYNEQDHRYEIVSVNQMAFMATATLGSDMCASGSAVLTGVKAASFSPFGMTPDIEEAQNPKKLCGVAGAEVTLVFNARWGNACTPAATTTGQWEVVQVEHREIEVILDHRIVQVGSDPVCCQHQIKRVKLCVMSCEELESIEWEVVPGPNACCQDPPGDTCCGCTRPANEMGSMRITFTGDITGTVDLLRTSQLEFPDCAAWEGEILSLGGVCAAEWDGLDVIVRCTTGGIEMLIVEKIAGSADCIVAERDYIAPTTWDCGGDPEKITGEWTFGIEDVGGGPCTCGGTINVSIEEIFA